MPSRKKKKEMCEDSYTTKRGTKWPSNANNGWSKCGTRNRIHRLKQSSWPKKGKYCMMRRPIQRLFPLGVNKGNMLGNEPTINCLADLNTTKTSSSSKCRYCQETHWPTVSTVDGGGECKEINWSLYIYHIEHWRTPTFKRIKPLRLKRNTNTFYIELDVCS